jgi:hypothetical protein
VVLKAAGLGNLTKTFFTIKNSEKRKCWENRNLSFYPYLPWCPWGEQQFLALSLSEPAKWPMLRRILAENKKAPWKTRKLFDCTQGLNRNYG